MYSYIRHRANTREVHASIKAVPRTNLFREATGKEMCAKILSMRNVRQGSYTSYTDFKLTKIPTKGQPKWMPKTITRNVVTTESMHEKERLAKIIQTDEFGADDLDKTADTRQWKGPFTGAADMGEKVEFQRAIQRSLAHVIAPLCPHGGTIPTFCRECIKAATGEAAF